MAVFVWFCFDNYPITYKKSLSSFQYSHCWKTREALLYDNRGGIGVVKWLYSSPIVLVLLRHTLHTFFHNSIISCASVRYHCTLKTQKFRTKDFFVRSTHSIEHQKCKYCHRRASLLRIFGKNLATQYTVISTPITPPAYPMSDKEACETTSPPT